MHIVLLILKIIGIILLSVLGLILLVLLLVLFVPLRYKAAGKLLPVSPEEEPPEGIKKYLTRAEGRVSWLLHIVSVKITYEDELKGAVRIFGIPLMKIGAENKNDGRKKNKKQKKKEEEFNVSENSVPTENETASADNNTEVLQTDVQSCENAGTSENQQDTAQDNSAQAEEIQTDDCGTGNNEQQESGDVQTSGGSKESVFGKVAEKVKNIYNTVKSIGAKVLDKTVSLAEKLDKLNDFRYDVRNRRAIAYAWDRLKRILKHLAPGKIKGYVHFGMEDGATTGYILGAVSTQFGKYGRHLNIRPDFSDEALDYDIMLKGRIRAFTLIRLAVCIYFNKDVKYLLGEVKKIK